MELRRAKECDFDFFYNLKCQNHSIKWSGFKEKPDRNRMWNFYKNTLCDKKQNDGRIRKLYIIEQDGLKIGYIGIDELSEPCIFDMPIGIDEAFIGKGYSVKAILLGLEKAKALGYSVMKGSIREDNVASMKAYEKCGATIKDTYREVYVEDRKCKIKMYDIEIVL